MFYTMAKVVLALMTLATILAIVLAVKTLNNTARDQIEFVTLHDMILLDVKSGKITKGDAGYKEGWACALVRPRDAKFVRSDLFPGEHGNTMLACFWKEPSR